MRATRLAAAAVALGLLAACGDTGTPGDAETSAAGEAAENGTGERRTDVDPLVRRFDLLDASMPVTWFSGTYVDAAAGRLVLVMVGAS